ncbi:MAG: amidohydrolase family protein [Vicinamibacterales bacterium]|nr:amidohydrolase family protein [Vicinamibacterales bacterium]
MGRRVVAWVSVLGALGVAALPLGAQRAPAQAPVSLLNATLVNVRDGSLQRNMTVHLREGRIAALEAGAPAAAGATVFDLRGRHLLPGLIDAHVHVANARALRTALESGVTTVRSAGAQMWVDVGLREMVRQGLVIGPDVLATGYHVRGGLGEDAFLVDPSLPAALFGAPPSVDVLRQVVRANLAHGVDWIKTSGTERAGLPDTDPRKQVFTEAEIRAIVAEAATKQVPVMAHAHGAEGALAAVKAGVRSIEHGTYLPDEALDLMASQGTYFVPTIDIVHDLAEVGGDYDHRDLQLRGGHMLPRLRETILRAQARGVKIVTGADTGYGPASVARVSTEILRLIDVGLTPLAALQAATATAAEMLRLERQIGAVESGFEADLLVVERNPLEEPSTLRDPLLVISNGRIGLDRLNFGRQ